jgi:AcrR family transcriptional regulator
MSRQGYDAFSIDALADIVHCSPATIYRHAGGKSAIRDAVMSRQAERILDSVREAITGLTGSERIVTATTVALQRMRADPLAQIMRSMTGAPGNEWLTDSPIVARFATEMIGLCKPDPLAAQWLIRVFLALWYWPLKDHEAEEVMVHSPRSGSDSEKQCGGSLSGNPCCLELIGDCRCCNRGSPHITPGV